MEQEKVWDAVSKNWAEFRNRPVNEVVEFVKGKSGKVLDLGCGSGRNFIESDDLKWYGIDFSQKLVDIAKERKYVDVDKGVTDNIPYDGGFFDYVVFVRVLHCVETEEKRKETLREIHRVLKSGGEAVISTIGPKNQRVKNKPKEWMMPWTVDGVKHMRYNYTYDKDEFEGQLKKAKFEIVKIWEEKNIIAIVRKLL